MHTRDAIQSRRTVHSFSCDPIPDGVLDNALADAILAPCHKLSWPWRFTVAGTVARHAIYSTDRFLRFGDARGPERLEEKIRAKLLNPAELVVVSQVRCDDTFRAREDYAAVACAVQNMSLSLWAQGVGSKWSSGKITRHPDTYTAVRIDPQIEEIVGFIWVGIPATAVEAVPRPPVASFVRRVD